MTERGGSRSAGPHAQHDELVLPRRTVVGPRVELLDLAMPGEHRSGPLVAAIAEERRWIDAVEVAEALTIESALKTDRERRPWAQHSDELAHRPVEVGVRDVDERAHRPATVEAVRRER